MKLKKRIVGFLLLLGIILIIVPLFFGRSIPSDELKLSAHIPTAPPKPKTIDVPIPPQNETVPQIRPIPPLSTVESNTLDGATSKSAALLNETASTPAMSIAAVTPVSTYTTPTAPPTNNNASNNKQNTITKGTAPSSQYYPVPKPARSPVVETPSVASTTSVAASAPLSTPTPSLAATQPPVAATPTIPKPIATNKLPTTINKPKITTSTVKESAKKAPTILPGVPAWAVQAGSFANKQNAEKLVKKLQAQGLTAYMHTAQTANKTITKVLVGPSLQRADADKIQARLQKEFNLDGAVVKIK